MLSPFGRWLRRQLARSDLNQTGLGHRLGITQSAISLWVHGKTQPDDDNIRRLAQVLSIPPEDVYAALGRIPPQDEEEDEWMREIRARLDAATPEQRARVAAVVRAMLEQTESGQKPCTRDTAEEADESTP